MLKVNSKIEIPLKEFDFSYARSPGPGGQNVNKVNTKVILKWAVGESTSLPEGVKERFLNKYARRISKTGELVLTSHRFRCPLTLQVVVTFTPAATPESKAASDDSQTHAEKVKAERQKDRQNARGAAVNLDDIAAWPKSDC